jgi:hypothetical protein
VLAYVVVSVTTDSCTAAAGVAAQAEAETADDESLEDDSIGDDEEEAAELVTVDSNTVMIWVVIVSVE